MENRRTVFYATLEASVYGRTLTRKVVLHGVSRRDVRRYVNRNKVDFVDQFSMPIKDAHSIKCVSVGGK